MRDLNWKLALPAKFRTEWLEALRSGAWTQGQNSLLQLEDEDADHGYCCLGVACAMSKVPDEYLISSTLPRHLPVEYGRLLPTALLSHSAQPTWSENHRDYIQLPKAYELKENTAPCFLLALVSFNDGCRSAFNEHGRCYTFYEIADWIERNTENMVTLEMISDALDR